MRKSNWKSSPRIGMKIKTHMKPPPRSFLNLKSQAPIASHESDAHFWCVAEAMPCYLPHLKSNWNGAFWEPPTETGNQETPEIGGELWVSKWRDSGLKNNQMLGLLDYCWWFRNPAFTCWHGSSSHYGLGETYMSGGWECLGFLPNHQQYKYNYPVIWKIQRGPPN